MKTLGIVGGVGPESTIAYYRQILSGYRERTGGPAQPRIIIDSIDAAEMLGYVTAGQLGELAELLCSAVDALAHAGADFALIASNTPHIAFNDVRLRSPIPLISIVEATARAAGRAELKRVGLLGTRFVMTSSMYRDVLEPAGIAVVSPTAADVEFVHEKYMGELFNGVIRPETRAGLLDVVERLRKSDGIDGLVLGGTELTMILGDVAELPGKIPVLDTAKIHAAEAVERLLV